VLLSGLEVPLEIVSVEVMAESVRASTHLESWRGEIVGALDLGFRLSF